MKAKEKAILELSRYEEKYPKGYDIIDPLIKPLCALLTENGYITMHSCSGHIKARKSKVGAIYPDAADEDKKLWMGPSQLSTQLYILFVATVPISDIRRAVDKINEKYNYNMSCQKVKKFKNITRRWAITIWLPINTKNADLYEIHKNIYYEFKKQFTK